jgi:hypothetical protein
MHEVRTDTAHKTSTIRDVCMLPDNVLEADLSIRSIKAITVYLNRSSTVTFVYHRKA